MTKIIIRGGIPDDTIITDFDNLPSSTLYKMGDYRLETNTEIRKIIDYSIVLNGFSKEYTLNNLNLSKTISEKLYNNRFFTLDNDYSNISSYSNYGSLADKISFSINNITSTYPYSLYLNNVVNETVFNTAINIIYNPNTNTTNFDIPSAIVNNVGQLVIDSGNLAKFDKNFNLNKTFYRLRLDENLDLEYSVINFIGNVETDQYLNFTVIGKPFNTTTASKKFHIKPNNQKYFEFVNNLTELEKYFLSNKKNNKYLIKIKKPVSNNIDINLIDTYLEWNFSDGYNIDNNNLLYKNFVEELYKIGLLYDQYKTNVIYRMYMTTSLKTANSENNKISILGGVYGETFDNVKMFIDGLAKLNTLGYDKNNSVPNILITNLSKTLGWDYKNIVSEKDFLNGVFTFTQEDISKSEIPSEINIELWRRIINNTSYFFKSKGTRNSIISFFKLIGIPEEFIELNEYVYKIENRINASEITNTSSFEIEQGNLPNYDNDGYPSVSNENSNYYFQVSGNTDLGQSYINGFRLDGFDLQRINDNKKTWVYADDFQIRDSNSVYYHLNDSREIINTKEITAGLSPSNAINYKIFTESSNNIGFNEYINNVIYKSADVKNRKIISDNLNGIYPKLSKIFYDYYILNNNFTYINLLKYIKKFDNYFVNFLDQLIPATVIYRGTGLITGNSLFTSQKHRYIRGINDGSEFIGGTQFLTCDVFTISNVDIVNVKGNQLGSISITVSGGNGDYYYSLDDENYVINSLIGELEIGTYSYYVKDAIGCRLIGEFEIENDCDVEITTIDVDVLPPVVTITANVPIPQIPDLPIPTPEPTINVQTCPLYLVDTYWSGPYISSNEACFRAPESQATQVKLFINEGAVVNNTVVYGSVNTAWLNCDAIGQRPALSGFYSDGTGWIYIGTIISQIGTNISGSGSCELNTGGFI